MVATGKKLAIIFYTMVKYKREYDESVYSSHRKKQLNQRNERLKTTILRLQNESANCG